MLVCVLLSHTASYFTPYYTTDYVDPVELLRGDVPFTAEKEEEVNILYVALTRARYRLVLNASKYHH
jgi:superfamily I DNA/RNA helicase